MNMRELSSTIISHIIELSDIEVRCLKFIQAMFKKVIELLRREINGTIYVMPQTDKITKCSGIQSIVPHVFR